MNVLKFLIKSVLREEARFEGFSWRPHKKILFFYLFKCIRLGFFFTFSIPFKFSIGVVRE